MSNARDLSAEEYWAAVPGEEIGAQVAERMHDYMQSMEQRGRRAMWQLAMRRHYGQGADGTYSHGSRVTTSGEQGEALRITVNHTRSLITTLLSLTTSDRLAFQATAATDDPHSVEQTVLAEQIWEWELEGGGLEGALLFTAERAVLLAEGWTLLGWDARAGEDVAVDREAIMGPDGEPEMGEDGQPAYREVPIREGALDVESLSPWDVARDVEAPDMRALRWVIVRRRMNRHDLAARYPEEEKRNAILGASKPGDDVDGLFKSTSTRASVTDQVNVLTLFHVSCDALPGGRRTMTIGDTMLEDGALPYEELPVYPMVPGEEIDSALGYSSSWDLLGLADALDGVESDILSVCAAGGQPNWTAPRDANVGAKDIAQRFTLVEYDGAIEPHPMQMPRPDKAFLDVSEHYKTTMQTLIGVNSVSRGDPEASLKSGAALALVQSMAIQHNSALQRAWAMHAAKVASAVIKRYQRFATTPRLIEITGDDEQTAAKNFQAKDISDVRRIKVELGSPLMRTMAGKEQVANTLLERFPGEITPEQYLTFMETGRLQPLYRAARSEAMGIKSENAALLRGDEVRALRIDNHTLHIAEHASLLHRPEIRMDEQVAATVLAHIAEHEELAISQPVLGQSPIGPDAGGGPPPPAGGPPPEPPQPTMADPGGPPPDMPSLPTDPMTGAEANVPAPEGVQ